jgi:hypothetical protein
MKCWIRIGGQDVVLRVGRTLFGRHDSCQVILDDPLASRRHAAIDFDGQGATAHDLGSVNGVLLNGRRISKPATVTDGDELRLGNQRVEFHLGVDASPTYERNRWGAETLSARDAGALGAPVPEEPTGVRDGEAFETLVVVASKMLALGRAVDAARIVKGPLEELERRVRAGERLEGETLELAADIAVQLAQGTMSGRWVSYAFSLYSLAGAVLPGSVIDRLYSAVRVVDSVDIGLVRSYVSSLRARESQLGPSERFLIRRLDGLEQLAIVS